MFQTFRPNVSQKTVRILRLLMVWCLPAAVFCTVIFSNVRNTGSDPRATLLVSESILTHGTICLDHYGDAVLDRYGRAIREKNGCRYHYFPLGTALVSLPFVALANVCGFRMVESEPELQMIIAALTASLTILLLIQTARLFLPPLRAGIIATVFWFGTSLASTCGTALWSHNFAVLFALAAIYAVLLEQNDPRRFRWIAVGVCVFFAYLCRPNMALLSPALLLFYFSFNRKAAVCAGSLIGLLLMALAGFSLHEYSQILPDYYLPQRLGHYEINNFPEGLNIPRDGYFWTAVFGNLFSPARGLFILSPFILFSWSLASENTERLKVNRWWMLVAIGWPVAHLIVISTYPLWWAGWSFGARLMTDVLPGLFLIPLCCRPPQRTARRIGLILFAVTAAFSIYVNTVQGLYNPCTALWNAEPNIDQHPEYLFDWNYPQFLHNQNRHEMRQVEHAASRMKVLTPGQAYSHDSQDICFAGWSVAEPTHRWSEGTGAGIYFLIDSPDVLDGLLSIDAGTLGSQRVQIELNGQEIFREKLEGWDASIRTAFNPSLLKPGINRLRFILPDAHPPEGQDQRILALALRSISLQ